MVQKHKENIGKVIYFIDQLRLLPDANTDNYKYLQWTLYLIGHLLDAQCFLLM
jgi:hypothetical protein